MRVLLAIDGSPHSDIATAELATCELPEGSEVRIITAIKPAMTPSMSSYSLPPDYYNKVETLTRDYATKTLARAEEVLSAGVNRDVPVTSEVITGSPTQIILTEADRWKADLIVVGSHGYTRREGVMLSNVSLAIAQAAKCSIETVRHRLEAK